MEEYGPAESNFVVVDEHQRVDGKWFLLRNEEVPSEQAWFPLRDMLGLWYAR
jgi:hypothetical protein